MNDAQSEPPDQTSFGAIDIVESFTALRHEIKLQVRDGRALRETTAEGLARLEQSLQGLSRSVAAIGQKPMGTSQDDSAARKLAEAIVEIEEALSRAVLAIEQTTACGLSSCTTAVVTDLQQRYQQLSPLRRWFAAGFFKAACGTVREHLDAVDPYAQYRTVSAGIHLLLTRVHRLMQLHDLHRVDVLGRPFDPDLMNAIEAVQSGRFAPGRVAEQLRPAYLWGGNVLRYAEVRIEGGSSSDADQQGLENK